MMPVLQDPMFAALRDKVQPVPDGTLARDQVHVTVRLKSGQALVSAMHGGVAPMTDDDLARKFRDQAGEIMAPPDVARLIAALRDIASVDDLEAIGSLL